MSLTMADQPPQSQPQDELNASERWDYERLKRLEIRGLDEYREMRAVGTLTPDAVVSFINQLSPWNLKTTGISVLSAYLSTHKAALLAEVLSRMPRQSPDRHFNAPPPPKVDDGSEITHVMHQPSARDGYAVALAECEAVLKEVLGK